MSLFNQLAGNQTQGGNPAQMMQELKKHPGDVLKRAGLNVPEGMTDPQQILGHLMQTGQIGGQRLQMARQMMGMLGLQK